MYFCHLTVFVKTWSLWYNRGDPSLTWAENQKVSMKNVYDRLDMEMLNTNAFDALSTQPSAGGWDIADS